MMVAASHVALGDIDTGIALFTELHETHRDHRVLGPAAAAEIVECHVLLGNEDEAERWLKSVPEPRTNFPLVVALMWCRQRRFDDVAKLEIWPVHRDERRTHMRKRMVLNFLKAFAAWSTGDDDLKEKHLELARPPRTDFYDILGRR